MPTPRPHPLTVGEPAPWFACPSRTRERFVFDSVGGRYVVLAFLGTGAAPEVESFLAALAPHRSRFDDERVCFFGVGVDRADLERPLCQDTIPGVRFLFDFDREVSAQYGALPEADTYRPVVYLLDPTLRVLAVFPDVNASGCARLLAMLEALPSFAPAEPARPQAPVLVVPNVFEPALCRELIAYYEKIGGNDSGFMRQEGDKTVGVYDHSFKRRRDCDMSDEKLRNSCMTRIHNRLAPELRKAFQFRATRMERYIISCYDAEEGGHFRAHRDNTTTGTAHRRFAVSLFLNSGEYEGGVLRFPEYGNALYTAPPGGAVVFGCSLLHEATPVTRGKRYMFLPFLYDDAAAAIREENRKSLKG